MPIHAGDTPTIKLAVTEDFVNVDMSGASARQLRFRKPDGTLLTKTATYEGPNLLTAALSTGETAALGVWEVQGHITGLSGWTGSTTKTTFTVDPAIPEE